MIDVAGWGGKTKTYDVTVDLHRLEDYGVTLPQVLQALNNSNINVGGQTIDISMQSAVVRGVGLIHSMDDISHTLLAAHRAAPRCELRDVANVTVGNLPRLGIAGQDNDDDIVQGIVLVRQGEQSMLYHQAHRSGSAARSTPPASFPSACISNASMTVSDLINVTTTHGAAVLIAGILLIFLVQWAFLGNLRRALIVATTIPFALFFAIVVMTARGESANLRSVGAIDFGLVVDATVIMMENIYRRIAHARTDRGRVVSGDSGATRLGLQGQDGRHRRRPPPKSIAPFSFRPRSSWRDSSRFSR